MPELPEVETIKNDLNSKILNLKISQVTVSLPKIVKNDLTFFQNILNNNSFSNINRRGKLIICSLKNGNYFLLVHLKMTGQLIYQKGEEIIAGGHNEDQFSLSFPNKHTHLFFTFSDQSRLFFNDLRQFGYLTIVDQDQLNNKLKLYGLEPLSSDFTLKNFRSLLHNRKKNVKAFLLDQNLIAGIGNIYADEVLFASEILPTRSIDTLQTDEIRELHKNIKAILKRAVKYRGTTFNNFVDANGQKGSFLEKLRVYKKEKEPCSKCGGEIIKKRIAGRGTRFCSECQR